METNHTTPTTHAEYPTPRVLAHTFLVHTFGDQFSALSSLAREVLTVDVMQMSDDDKASYSSAIGVGNLASYAEVMISDLAWRYVRQFHDTTAG